VSEVKCVVWDLDGTLWPGIAVEAEDDERLEPFPRVVAAMRRLADAGVLNAVASRTSPGVGARLDAFPEVTDLLVARRLGWHDKSLSVEAIAEELGIGADALLLVDDSAFERAEVTAHTAARAVEPSTFLASLADFLPASVSSQAADRTRHYQAESRRRTAAAAYADQRAFLDACDLRLRVGPALPEDRARVLELARRVRRLSSTAMVVDDVAFDTWGNAGDREILVARLTDRFGDYGLIGLALVATTDAEATVSLLAVSCRVSGRGVAQAFLAELARRHLPRSLVVPITATSANVELRLLVRTLGLELEQTGPDSVTAYAAPGSVGDDAAPWVAVEAAT
jgi:methoxymalonate biosynthesis protein